MKLPFYPFAKFLNPDLETCFDFAHRAERLACALQKLLVHGSPHLLAAYPDEGLREQQWRWLESQREGLYSLLQVRCDYLDWVLSEGQNEAALFDFAPSLSKVLALLEAAVRLEFEKSVERYIEEFRTVIHFSKEARPGVTVHDLAPLAFLRVNTSSLERCKTRVLPAIHFRLEDLFYRPVPRVTAEIRQHRWREQVRREDVQLQFPYMSLAAFASAAPEVKRHFRLILLDQALACADALEAVHGIRLAVHGKQEELERQFATFQYVF